MKTVSDEFSTFLPHAPVKLIDDVIMRASAERASDIHIEPYEHECRIRIRVDGDLVLRGRYKRDIHEEVVARLKVLSSLRTDLRTVPQDGRFRAQISGSTTAALNVRVSIVPSFYGEKSVLRLLPSAGQMHTLESLGFSAANREKIGRAVASNHGMILVVGPTGSGKTTTLYVLLQAISGSGVSTVTLEDPVEYAVPGITQIPIHGNGQVTFVSALRSVLRQDPDVIMVGEIRDTATAQLSTHAAMTGHVVLSTLHTNDAVTVLPRLFDMGVEPFLVASTVRAVISQRLVRKICFKCRTERRPTVAETEFLRRKSANKNANQYVIERIFYGRGCDDCRKTGFAGRMVVSEVLVVDEKIRSLINQKASLDEIQRVAVADGMKLISADALEKVRQGETTIEEITSIC